MLVTPAVRDSSDRLRPAVESSVASAETLDRVTVPGPCLRARRT